MADLVEEKADWIAEIYESKRVQTIIVLVGLSTASASIGTARSAYTEFRASTAEYSDLVDSWSLPPITGLFLSATSTCPASYELIEPPTWKGSSSGACACPVGAEGFSSNDEGSCTSSATSAGCISQPAVEPVPLTLWRGSYLCSRTEGEAQLDGSKTRPEPSSSGECKSGYDLCGAADTTAATRAVCVPTGTSCPLTGATAESTAAAPPAGFSAGDAQTSSDASAKWYTRTKFSGEMPINRIMIALYDPAEDGKRGDCFGINQDQRRYKEAADSYSYESSYPKECAKVDTRWERLDGLLEEALLNDHFQAHANCTSAVAVTADYVDTGTPCGATPSTNTDCMVEGLPAVACAPGDAICEGVVFQSKCGALTRFADQSGDPAGAGTLEWAFFFRREVYWKSGCDAPMTELADKQREVLKIKDQLKGNFIANMIVNISIGMILPIIKYTLSFILNCSSGCEDLVEQLRAVSKYPKAVLCGVKMIFAYQALTSLSVVDDLMRLAADGKCAADDDELTTLTFENMADNIESSRNSLEGQVYIDWFDLVVILAMPICAYIFGGKALVDCCSLVRFLARSIYACISCFKNLPMAIYASISGGRVLVDCGSLVMFPARSIYACISGGKKNEEEVKGEDGGKEDVEIPVVQRKIVTNPVITTGTNL